MNTDLTSGYGMPPTQANAFVSIDDKENFARVLESLSKELQEIIMKARTSPALQSGEICTDLTSALQNLHQSVSEELTSSFGGEVNKALRKGLKPQMDRPEDDDSDFSEHELDFNCKSCQTEEHYFPEFQNVHGHQQHVEVKVDPSLETARRLGIKDENPMIEEQKQQMYQSQMQGGQSHMHQTLAQASTPVVKTTSDFELTPDAVIGDLTKGPRMYHLNIEVSEQYEMFPEDFKKKVHKMHPQLVEMMQFYQSFYIDKINYQNGEPAMITHKKSNVLTYSNDKLLDYLFTQKASRVQFQCYICFCVGNVNKRTRHMEKQHFDIVFKDQPIKIKVMSDQKRKGRRHYDVYEYIYTKSTLCPLGCGFSRDVSKFPIWDHANRKSEFAEIRRHLILNHSFRELRKWGINREYLKYQEGLITKEHFCQQLETFKADIHRKDQKVASKAHTTHFPMPTSGFMYQGLQAAAGAEKEGGEGNIDSNYLKTFSGIFNQQPGAGQPGQSTPAVKEEDADPKQHLQNLPNGALEAILAQQSKEMEKGGSGF